jgi:hypothetical protein
MLSKLLVIIVFISSIGIYAQDNRQVAGVTIDAIDHLAQIYTSLKKLPVKPTVRIVFDEWQPASEYTDAVNNLGRVSYIMGELLDSYYMNQYSNQQFHDRVVEYMNTLGDKVDIWEIGNEINGEWLGPRDSVVKKMTDAYNIIKYANRTTALTLYYNKNCWEHPENEMFRWANENIPQYMKDSLDYVFVSYYEDDCNGYQPNWQQVFDSLYVIFPNSKLGIGECGTRIASKKAEYMKRYYLMYITTPNYVGGYFWWYYKKDCVPYTNSLWNLMFKLFTRLGGLKSDF